MGKLTVIGLQKWAKDFESSGRDLAVIGDGNRLYLRAKKSSKKSGEKNDQSGASYSWLLKWESPVDGKGKSLGVGAYLPHGAKGGTGSHTTLAQARKAADDLAARLAAGQDPAIAKRTQKDLQAAEAATAKAARKTAEDEAAELARRSVMAAVNGWYEASKGDLTSDKYSAQKLRRLKEYGPLIGERPVKLLSRADVVEAHEALLSRKAEQGGEEKCPRVETVRRMSADLEKAIDWAIDREWRDGENPVTGARRALPKAPRAVHRRTVSPDEVGAFWKVASAADSEQTYPVCAHLLRLLTLTAARTKELRGMVWADVEDLDGKTPRINVPAHRMKRRVAWTCYLSPAAVQILKDIRQWQSEAGQGVKTVEAGMVFVHLEGNYRGRALSENAVNVKLKQLGLHDDIVGHGLRALFSTLAHDCWPYQGPNRTEAIEYSLAHASEDKVRAAYDRNDFRELRIRLANWWSDYLGNSLETRDNVVPLRTSA